MNVFVVTAYGAVGIALDQRELVLSNLRYKWIQYPPNTTATIRYPVHGKDHDSVGIQRAIDAAHAAGGGTVVVPAGDYLIGPIALKSRVRLHLEPGARLWGSPRLEDYVNRQGLAADAPTFLDPAGPGRHPAHAAQPGASLNLITAVDAEDVAVTGMGEIHSQSPQWVIPWMNSKPENWSSLNHRRPAGPLLFLRCRRVAVEGIGIHDSPSWTLVFSGCQHVRVDGVRMRHFDVINADGIDLLDTSHVTITNCDLHVTDDGICLKNDKTNPTPAGVRNVAVSNCVIRTWCNGVKIGTESNGVFEDITFSNIVVHNPDDDLKGAEGGINVCCCDGGLVRNVAFRGFVMRNVECPFYVVTTPRRSSQQAYRTPRPGRIERLAISGIQADATRYTPFIVGCPGAPVCDVTLTDIDIRMTAEFRPGPFAAPVPACAEQYPTPFMFGSPEGGRRDCGDGLPAHGLYLRDVQGIRVRGLQVTCTQPDGRPRVVTEACTNVAEGGW